jgi:hypothetical protein
MTGKEYDNGSIRRKIISRSSEDRQCRLTKTNNAYVTFMLRKLLCRYSFRNPSQCHLIREMHRMWKHLDKTSYQVID